MSKEFVYKLGKEPDEEGFSGEIKVKVKGGVFKPKIEDYSFNIKKGDNAHSQTLSFKNPYFTVLSKDYWLMDGDAMVHKLGEKVGLATKENGVYVTKVPNRAEMELNDNGSLRKLYVRLDEEIEEISSKCTYCTAEATDYGKWKVTDERTEYCYLLSFGRNMVIEYLEKTPYKNIIDKYFSRALADYRS